jgi:hypothetical protein
MNDTNSNVVSEPCFQRWLSHVTQVHLCKGFLDVSRKILRSDRSSLADVERELRKFQYETLRISIIDVVPDDFTDLTG